MAHRLHETLTAASGGPLDAYVDTVNTQPLLEPLPSPGSIAGTSTNEQLGITEWRLSNGARVILKPTTFKEDEILDMMAYLLSRGDRNAKMFSSR